MKVVQAFTFEAAHRLPHMPACHPCRRLHGHSYRVELKFDGQVDPHTGFVIDFFEIERVFTPILRSLDHQFLNEVEGLDNPTAENISIWIWTRTKALLPTLSLVAVYETPNCWAEYDGTT
jgi:6-pyruvoyltetrahydropterin/6-carboxytetrahydropterin synthase